MSSVFKKTEFELCSLPLPSGYPQYGHTHCGIQYSESPINGYQYFMALSPFPYENDDYENPCFFYAVERENGVPPKDFVAYPNNPLEGFPGGSDFNSDPDILIYGNELYVSNRPFYRQPLHQAVHVSKAIITNGNFSFADVVSIYDSQNFNPVNFGFPSDAIVTGSPALVEYKGQIRVYQIYSNSYNDGTQCKSITIVSNGDLNEPNSFKEVKIGSIFGKNLETWHIDMFTYKGKLYAIVNAVDTSLGWSLSNRNSYAYLAVADESGENFRIYDKPLSDISAYRSSAIVRPDGMFVFYLATLNYKPTSEYSEDGRNIMLAYKPFEEVLKALDSK